MVQLPGKGKKKDIDVLKERFNQLHPTGTQPQNTQLTQQAQQATTQQQKRVQQQAQPPRAQHQAVNPQQTLTQQQVLAQQQAYRAAQQVAWQGQQQASQVSAQELAANQSATRTAAMQSVASTQQTQQNPQQNQYALTPSNQARSPQDILENIPVNQQSINLVELEGDSIVDDQVINPQDIARAQDLATNQNDSENIVEKRLEELKEKYDDAKLNSVIIEQVKELIEIDNNLNNKIEDLRADLKKEIDEREKLNKKIDDNYKELKELEDSIQKFIALYEVVTNQFNPFVKKDPQSDTRMKELLHGNTMTAKFLGEKRVAEGQQFITKTGKQITSLQELTELLEHMTDSEFSHHVTAHKNDFAVWIHEALKDDELAGEVGKHKSRTAVIAELKKHTK